MAQVQIIPGDFRITDSTAPRYPIRKVITSDDFSTLAGEPVGTSTTAALGGTPKVWEGSTPSGWTGEDGVLRTAVDGGAGNLTITGLADGVTVEVKIVEMPPTPGLIFMSLRASETERTHLAIRGDRTMVIRQQDASGQVDLADTGVIPAVGDRVRFGVDQGVASLWVNGALVKAVSTTVAAPSWLALSYYPTSATAAIDDVVITGPLG